MSPEEIKKKVQDVYQGAMANRSVQWQRQSGSSSLFHDVKLYGKDAGTDFAQTHLEAIVQEAVAIAKCKEASLSITLSGWGMAALEGLAQALHELTTLQVHVSGSTIILSWADATPRLT